MTLEKAAETIVKTCMNLQKGEKALVITDFRLCRIGDIILSEARKITETDMIEIPVGKENGEEPPEDAAEDMKHYDVIIIPTTKSLSHTKARRDANSAGARIATLPGITEETMERCIDIDYGELKERHEKIKKELIGSKEIRIATELGADVTTSVINTHGDTGMLHKKGDFGNLPTGEVDSGVKEGETNGKIIVDASFGGIGKLENPIIINVEKGYAVRIEGGEEAERLKEKLDSFGKEAYKIAELGIGTNPKAIITGNILEDEKALGTVHFALGNDVTYGGKNNVQIHLDGIITKPTIYIDGKKIMDKGELLI